MLIFEGWCYDLLGTQDSNHHASKFRIKLMTRITTHNNLNCCEKGVENQYAVVSVCQFSSPFSL
jgi:hypothetical protein